MFCSKTQAAIAICGVSEAETGWTARSGNMRYPSTVAAAPETGYTSTSGNLQLPALMSMLSVLSCLSDLESCDFLQWRRGGGHASVHYRSLSVVWPQRWPFKHYGCDSSFKICDTGFNDLRKCAQVLQNSVHRLPCQYSAPFFTRGIT